MRLVLGVADVAYSHSATINGVTSLQRTTTSDVAEILETRYHVMETFFELRRDRIAELLANSVADALGQVVNGGPVATPTYAAEQQIEAMFRAFLDADEMTKLWAAFGNAPLSLAAQHGVSHRKKRPYAQRDARPAFIDTGLYRSSFRAWVAER